MSVSRTSVKSTTKPRRTSAKSGRKSGFPGVPDRLNQAELQRVTGLSRQTLAEWAREPDCPFEVVDGTRLYLWPQWNEWRLAKITQSVRERAPTPSSADEAKARKLAAEAELAEFQLARERVDLIRPADAIKASEQMLDRLRARLVAVPGREAHRFVGLKRLPQAVRELTAVIDAVLVTLSGDLSDDVEESE